MRICTKCHRELKVGQRILRNYKLIEIVEGEHMDQKLDEIDFQHSDCWDADGARFRNDGVVVDDRVSRVALRELNLVLDEQKIRNETWTPKTEGESNGSESNQSNEG